jgi:hypothetical protein
MKKLLRTCFMRVVAPKNNCQVFVHSCFLEGNLKIFVGLKVLFLTCSQCSSEFGFPGVL